MVSQNKVNPSLAASSAKTSFFKSFLSPTPRKQFNSLQVDLFSKLASNSKLTSDKHKKYFKNNLCLYYGTGDYKLNSYSKKQTMVTLKGCSALVTADPLVATSEKPSEK